MFFALPQISSVKTSKYMFVFEKSTSGDLLELNDSDNASIIQMAVASFCQPSNCLSNNNIKK